MSSMIATHQEGPFTTYAFPTSPNIQAEGEASPVSTTRDKVNCLNFREIIKGGVPLLIGLLLVAGGTTLILAGTRKVSAVAFYIGGGCMLALGAAVIIGGCIKIGRKIAELRAQENEAHNDIALSDVSSEVPTMSIVPFQQPYYVQPSHFVVTMNPQTGQYEGTNWTPETNVGYYSPMPSPQMTYTAIPTMVPQYLHTHHSVR